MEKSLVLVGASYAATHLAAAARDQGYTGKILLIGEEQQAPYQRPPLSKGFLTGKVTEDNLPLKSAAFYSEERIDLITGRRVTAIDRSARQICLDDATTIPYDFLGITTGARCRRLSCPGADLKGVHYLRNLDDAQALSASSRNAQRIIVIGGGFIGLEVAAALRSIGKDVCVVESVDRVLARVFPPLLSEFLQNYHSRNGIQFVLNVKLTRFCEANGRVTGIELDDGRSIDGDLVLVAIGVTPNTELAQEAGLAVRDGIVVDRFGCTSDSHIFAAGDCARYPNPWASDQEDVRLESIQSANDLARAAASTIAGRPMPYSAVPWFWSDQGAIKLQMAGLSSGWDRLLLRGAIEQARFSIFYFKGDRLLGADTVNHPSEHMQVRKLLAAGVSFADAPLEDSGFDLKTLIQTATTGKASPVRLASAPATNRPT